MKNNTSAKGSCAQSLNKKNILDSMGYPAKVHLTQIPPHREQVAIKTIYTINPALI